MRVVVAGGSGFLGRALIAALRRDGHEVVRLVRRNAVAADEVRWDPAAELAPSVLAGVDAVVNLCGAGVGDRRWTAEYKRVLVESRVGPTSTLARALAAAGSAGPGVLLNASAVGVYGDRGDEELTEESASGSGFFPELVRAWEGAASPASAAGVRVAMVRTGLVLGPGGGLLGPMLPLFRFGLGGRMGSGRQWMPWITLADVVGAIGYLLAVPVHGPVNLAGPAPVRNAEFARTLGAVLHRPALLPAPGFGLRLVLGEFGREAVTSQRVRPAVLAASGYQFVHDDLTTALRWATGR